jgi:hypothetical protein
MAKRKSPSANGDNGVAPATPAPAAPTPSDGRDASTGRFAPGWKGGPGNPHNRRIAALKRALFAGVTDEDFTEIARKLVEMARAGNLDAVDALFKYTIGAPKKSTIDPDCEELDDLHAQQLARRARKDALMSEILDR